LARTTYNRACVHPTAAVHGASAPYPVRLTTPRASLNLSRNTALRVVRDARTLKATDGPGSRLQRSRARRQSTSQQLAGGRTRRPERVHDAGGRSASEPNLRAPAINPAKTRRHRRCAARRAAFLVPPSGSSLPESLSAPFPAACAAASSHRHSDGSLGHILAFSFTLSQSQHTLPKASDY
jgi:hypothetical protein